MTFFYSQSHLSNILGETTDKQLEQSVSTLFGMSTPSIERLPTLIKTPLSVMTVRQWFNDKVIIYPSQFITDWLPRRPPSQWRLCGMWSSRIYCISSYTIGRPRARDVSSPRCYNTLLYWPTYILACLLIIWSHLSREKSGTPPVLWEASSSLVSPSSSSSSDSFHTGSSYTRISTKSLDVSAISTSIHLF